MNGPGAWMGTHLLPVKAPQIKKIVTTEITLAQRSGRTALSSPKVTVLSEVKSFICRNLRTPRRTTKNDAAKIAT